MSAPEFIYGLQDNNEKGPNIDWNNTMVVL